MIMFILNNIMAFFISLSALNLQFIFFCSDINLTSFLDIFDHSINILLKYLWVGFLNFEKFGEEELNRLRKSFPNLKFFSFEAFSLSRNPSKIDGLKRAVESWSPMVVRCEHFESFEFVSANGEEIVSEALASFNTENIYNSPSGW